jgi:chaperonin cofactor prefoldin
LGSTGVNVGIGISVPTFQLQLSTNSAAKPTSSTWTISSDARLKTVDGTYNRGLSDVLKLNTVKYHYNKGNARNLPTEEQGYGFVAQELQQVYPEAVKQNEDGYLSVDFHPVLVSYINAIKELNTKAENQTKELYLMKKQNESLQQQIDELKALIKK